MDCRHRWIAAGSLSRAECERCGLTVEKVLPKRLPRSDRHERGRHWYPLAMIRWIKHPSSTQAAPSLA